MCPNPEQRIRSLAASLLISLLIAASGCGSLENLGSLDTVYEAEEYSPQQSTGTESETGPDSDGAEDISDEQEHDGSCSETCGTTEEHELSWTQGQIEAYSPEPVFCDDPVFNGAHWLDVEIDDITYRFIPGTRAEADLPMIAEDRQRAYDQIAEFLQLTSRPHVTVVLSPNRMAARHHGYGVGRAVKSLARVDVLWPAGEGSYEQERPGHELAHILATHVDGKLGRLAFLDEGLAEYLDASGRDLHRAYVDNLVAGQELGFPTRLDDWDAWGRNYGRAGSFVAFLVERYGRERFLDLWRAAAATGGWSQVTTLGDAVECGASLEVALDRLLMHTYGVGFEAVRLAWEATLRPYFEAPGTELSEEDLIEIMGLLGAADRAISSSDAVGFRATLEGFYCDQWTDDEKAELSREVVVAYERLETTVVAAFPVGIRNYQEAIVHTVRREFRRGEEATLRTQMLWVERFPEGWRISWSTVW